MKTLAIIALILGILFLAFQLYITFSTAKTEAQPYDVVSAEKGFEIRHYPASTLAQVSSSATSYRELSSSGFRKLAGYIFGGNEEGTKIAMTSPVHMDINDSSSTMSFVMPSEYEKESLPTPNDRTVKIIQSEDEHVAVLQFGGFANDKVLKTNATKLKALLDANNIEYTGNFRYLGYNPPYQLIGRKNEVMVRIIR